MLLQEFQDLVHKYLPDRHADDWDVPGLLNDVGQICSLPQDLDNEDAVDQLSRDEVSRRLAEHAETSYEAREAELGSEQIRVLERLLLLRAIDIHWVNHLTGMENLRTGIGLHAYGQRDPLVMYRTEGHKMFQELMQRMQYDVVHSLFHVTVAQPPVNGGHRGRAAPKSSPMQDVNPKQREPGRPTGKVGRNAPCPCGSGKKYKRCHGASVQ
jgi:preprotein translocase subunit SecA